MTIVPPPTDLTFGHVVGRFLHARGDTAVDPDRMPDFVPATGTVTFVPKVVQVISTTPPATLVLKDPIVSEVVAGVLTDDTGQPGQWLITGTYTVKYKIGNIDIPDVELVVTQTGTTEDPLANPIDLALYQPLEPTPTIKFIVNEQVYLDTLQARDEAEQFAIDASNAVGAQGKSAYQVAVDNGFVGTEAEWLVSLEGATGPEGPQGPAGIQGPVGPEGPIGLTGPQGEVGPQGIQGIPGVKGDTGDQGPIGLTGPQGEVGPQGPAGVDGDSAYEVAVAAGFVGTQAAWLTSLEGADGAQGPQGDIGPQGPEGPQGIQGIPGSDGLDGDSAYDIAVAGGFVGTEAQWIASLEGAQGPQGPAGDSLNFSPNGSVEGFEYYPSDAALPATQDMVTGRIYITPDV